MRITFILPFASLSGGVRVVAAYAKALSEAGHEVHVVSRPKRIRGSALKILMTRLSQCLFSRAQKPPTPLLDFLGPRHVILDRYRPVETKDVPDADVVIATWWETAQSVAGFPASKGRKFYLIQDYEVFDNLPKQDVAATYKLPLHKLAVSSYIKDSITQNHDVNDITVLPNAVDTNQFQAQPRSRRRPLTIGFLYHAHPRKNSALAIEAIRLARIRIPGLQVIAFGRKAPLERFNMPDWVDFRVSPAQCDIAQIYAACDAWLFTSGAEGFGLPLLEAMACRTPVLATSAGAARDLIDGTNGKVLESEPTNFAEAIVKFDRLSDAQWRAYSDSAYQTARAYSWDAAAERLVAHLKEI